MIFTIHFNRTCPGRSYQVGDRLTASKVFSEYFIDTGRGTRPHAEVLGMIYRMACGKDPLIQRPNPTEHRLRVGDTITLHDSMIVPTMYAVEPEGFKRLSCSCLWRDGGTGETGPSPEISEPDALCPIHGEHTDHGVSGFSPQPGWIRFPRRAEDAQV